MERVRPADGELVAIGTCSTPVWTHGNRFVAVDVAQRRVWVGGQRLHHGATGVAVVAAGLAQVAARRTRPARGLAYLLAGGALAAHDWKDRRIWFERGVQASR